MSLHPYLFFLVLSPSLPVPKWYNVWATKLSLRFCFPHMEWLGLRDSRPSTWFAYYCFPWALEKSRLPWQNYTKFGLRKRSYHFLFPIYGWGEVIWFISIFFRITPQTIVAIWFFVHKIVQNSSVRIVVSVFILHIFWAGVTRLQFSTSSACLYKNQACTYKVVQN